MRTWLLILMLCWGGIATAADSPGLGNIAIPSPQPPAAAEHCVEPVEVMRREHMNFLLHERDASVIDGKRGGKYSLTGCMDCHNPASADKIVRYQDPEHFCAECHNYTGVKIDCFECHADRGLEQVEQSSLWRNDDRHLNATSLKWRLEQADAD